MKPSMFSLPGWMVCLALAVVAQAFECPSSCADLFGRLEDGVQEVQLQLRGEPKSGTGTSGEWAWGGLIGTCIYLKSLYGEDTCRVNYNKLEKFGEIVFEPAFADKSAPCTCNGVTRVAIGYSKLFKHTLPVTAECAYWHNNSIPKAAPVVCNYGHELPEESLMGLWRCVEDAKCTFNDERLQLAVMRDPRAVTVSAYFHTIREHPDLEAVHPSVDRYFQQFLRPICMWTAVRYLLFTEFLSDRSQMFYFEDLLVDPVDWYGRFLYFVGLDLPAEIVLSMARVASEGGELFGVNRKGVDEHPGSVAEGNRTTFRDELGPESLAMMDDVMRTLLPPVLLKRYGI